MLLALFIGDGNVFIHIDFHAASFLGFGRRLDEHTDRGSLVGVVLDRDGRGQVLLQVQPMGYFVFIFIVIHIQVRINGDGDLLFSFVNGIRLFLGCHS